MLQNGLGILCNVESDIVETHSFSKLEKCLFLYAKLFYFCDAGQKKRKVLLAFFEDADVIFHDHCIYFYYWGVCRQNLGNI